MTIEVGLNGSLSFKVSSEFLTVIKSADKTLINLWRPVKGGKRLVYLYNSEKGR